MPSYPELPGATNFPAHPDAIIQHTRQICAANPSEKRMGGEDEEAQ